jgi:tRNA pseudouridine32 synthase/23S rRNA pseudouridine746 synthase
MENKFSFSLYKISLTKNYNFASTMRDLIIENNIDCLHNFNSEISHIDIPDSISYPFYYIPHQLAEIAALELRKIIHRTYMLDSEHDYERFNGGIGKMFGVLVVQKSNGELAWLAGFSGKLYDESIVPGFVPPVFDTLEKQGFYKNGEQEINIINQKIALLEMAPEYLRQKQELYEIRKIAAEEIAQSSEQLKANKKIRKEKRKEFDGWTNEEQKAIQLRQLDYESIRQNYELKDLKVFWKERLLREEEQLESLEAEIKELKLLRQKMSSDLQKQLFENYKFLNYGGKEKSLMDIFEIDEYNRPPSGAGECAAPKLFQFAFQHGLTPIAMAEFWIGKSPATEVRKHGQFYPACISRCKPILAHMLTGVRVEQNPMLTNPAVNKELPVIYEDDYMIAVHKPADMLSVPGKNIEDSVYSRIKIRYPEALGALIVHRLDMSTSGVMLLAKTKEAHRILQAQFIRRKVKKRYLALLEGEWKGPLNGEIDLPLRVDLDNRPQQLVCYEYGKKATTRYSVIESFNGFTRVHFYPITGRTHQLRVHAAHTLGLNMAIKGDDLYGNRADRLYLHAEWIEFMHPHTKEIMALSVGAGF